MLPLGQVKITAVSTPQEEKVKSQNILRVKLTFKIVGKVESLLCLRKGGNSLLNG